MADWTQRSSSVASLILDRFVPHNHICQLKKSGTVLATFTEIRSGSEAGLYVRLIDFVYHSTLGLTRIKKKQNHSSGGDSPAMADWTQRSSSVASLTLSRERVIH